MKREKGGPWYRFCVIVLKPTLLALTKRKWSGREHVPREGGVILVANHISYADPITLAHFVHDSGRVVRYLTKAQVFDVKFIGRIVRGAGQIPVYRQSRQAMDSWRDAVAGINEGKCVVFLAEGTITRDPELWPMVAKTGAARVALTTEAPVIPIAQWGAHEVLPPYASRPDLMPRKTIHVKAGPPVDLSEFKGKELTPDVLHAATDKIMAAVTALLEEIRGEKAPPERFDPVKAGVPLTGNPHVDYKLDSGKGGKS